MGLEFTGERYVPELLSGKISYEHWHRYLFAKELCKGKKVLDVACGEGYGSAYLASVAATVVGVDVSETTVEHAINTYSMENLSFINSSASQLPFNDNEQEVIVCYETIEHLDSLDQESFMKEAKRILKDDGILLISTPNKLIYSDEPAYANPYHLKEFYEEEFRTFLGNYFSDIKIFYQQIFCGSVIQQKQATDFTAEYIHFTERGFVPGRSGDMSNSEYILAICTNNNKKLLTEESGSILIDESNQLYKEKII
jgi:O-antigen biosynthesis protein